MANTKDYLLPDLGEGLTEGEVVKWLVAVGDSVDVDQPVAEVETAKAAVELPSPFAGTVTALHAEVGDEVEVGKPLITVDLGEGGRSRPPAGGDLIDGASAPAAGPTPDSEPTPDGEPRGTPPDDAEASDMVPEPADQDDAGSGSVLVGYGTAGGRRSRRRRSGVAGQAGSGAHASTRPLAKPPVRKLAKDLGIDLTDVSGSGPEGVITREDIHSYSDAPPPSAPTAPTHTRAGDGEAADEGVVVTTPTHERLPSAPPGDRRIPLRGVRRAIAEKMTLSRREIPDATSWVDCDATALWELRESLNTEQTDVRVSPLALVMRICVAGIRRFPEVNATLDAEAGEIVLQGQVNFGFAAQTDRGLVVPVIKNAHQMSALELAAELNRLAEAARAGKVTPAEMTGGTFTVSNYGSFGVDGGSPIINHPEAAILGVGRITERPWVVDGNIAARRIMQLSIAFDHRICDGGEAAGFLRFVADCVESPARLLASL